MECVEQVHVTTGAGKEQRVDLTETQVALLEPC